MDIPKEEVQSFLIQWRGSDEELLNLSPEVLAQKFTTWHQRGQAEAERANADDSMTHFPEME